MGETLGAPFKKPESKRENRAYQIQKTCPSEYISSPIDQILFLQRNIRAEC